jgi:hypothetical protein
LQLPSHTCSHLHGSVLPAVRYLFHCALLHPFFLPSYNYSVPPILQCHHRYLLLLLNRLHTPHAHDIATTNCHATMDSSSAHPHSPAHHQPHPLSQTRELCCGCFAGVEYHSQCRGGARCIAQCRPIQPRARKRVGRAERRHRMEWLGRPMATHHRSCFCVHGRGCQASQRRQRCRHDISTWRHRSYPGTLCARNRTHRSDNGVS